MGVPPDLEALVARSHLMKESLDRSQAITENMIDILNSFDRRLSSLDAIVLPTQEGKEIRRRSRLSRTSGLNTTEVLDNVFKISAKNSMEDDKILIHTHAIRKAHENIDNTLKAAEAILEQFDVCRKVESKILGGPNRDLDGYLHAVDNILANIQFFTENRSFKTSDGALHHAQSLLSKAMIKLEEELYQVLNEHSKVIDPVCILESLPTTGRHFNSSLENQSGTSGIDYKKKRIPTVSPNAKTQEEKNRDALHVLPTLLSPHVITKLNDLVKRMVSAGHHQQCLRAYREIRTPIIEHTFHKIGVEKLCKDDVQKLPWELLEGKIASWTQCMHVAAKLFAGERKICNQIFHNLDPHKNHCFADVTGDNVSTLLSFGEAVAKCKKSPEKLFVLLDMYETMCDILPEMQVLFEGKECAGIRQKFEDLSKTLAQTARDTFDLFEEAVEKDATKSTVQDGTVHPLTSYVINYVKFLYDYQASFNLLFGENEKGDPVNLKLATAAIQIMAVLQENLDVKSKQYKDPALGQIFLMNNMHYIVRSVQRSEAKDVFGEDWVQRQRRIVQQHATGYQRAAWAKVLQCLNTQDLTSSGNGMSGTAEGSISPIPRALLKERFKNFNNLVEELHQHQAQWTIPDAELRECLRLAVAEVLLPAYRSFLRRFSSVMENGKNPQKYIKYSLEDLEQLLADFFEGKSKK